jgi:rhodanese-related sulfurtransferase
MSESTENEKEQIFRNISPEEAFQLFEKVREDPDFIILDVRTPKEFNTDHIEGAMNVDFRGEGFTEEMKIGDKEKKYLIYCGSGVRASKAMGIMKELEYLEVYNILGGIRMWKVSNFPVIEE